MLWWGPGDVKPSSRYKREQDSQTWPQIAEITCKCIQYSNAATFRTTAPSSCSSSFSLCLGPTGQPPTFWKYRFTQHIVLHHTDENLENSPVPFDLLKKVYISLAERMGKLEFREYDERENYGIPNIDAFEGEPLN